MPTYKPWIYGTVPEPVGGVSVFLSRLIYTMDHVFEGLVDPYFGNHKVTIPIKHIYAKKKRILERVKVTSHLLRLGRVPLFVNGSRPESILAIAPLVMLRSARTGLMLHHGDLEKSIQSRPWLAPMIRAALNSYQEIACLSEGQRNFYNLIGVQQNRLKLVETYLPPVEKAANENLSSLAQETIDWIRSSDRKVFIGSGYAYPYYRHDWGLEYQDDRKNVGGARYLLCCYGPETDHLLELRKRFMGRDDAKLVFGLKPFEFDQVLAECSVYIRPTDTDSYGMATRDALEKGLSVIASDVCERAHGTRLHRVGDRLGFFSLLDQTTHKTHSDEVKNLSELNPNVSNRWSVVDWISNLTNN